MYSDNSWDSDDVCVIRRPVFEADAATMSQHFAEFLRLACGVTSSKPFFLTDVVDGGFAAIAACPPFALEASEFRVCFSFSHPRQRKGESGQPTCNSAT